MPRKFRKAKVTRAMETLPRWTYGVGLVSLIPILGILPACFLLVLGFVMLKQGGWKLHVFAVLGLAMSAWFGPALYDSAAARFPILPPSGRSASKVQRGLVAWREPAKGLEEAQRTGKPMFMDFTAEWCGWCHRLEADVFNLPETAKFIEENFIPIRVMDRSREEGKNTRVVSDLQGKYGVRGFPTLVVASHDQSRSNTYPGYGNAEAITAFLNTFLKP